MKDGPGGYDRALDDLWDHQETITPCERMSMRGIILACAIGLAFWGVVTWAVIAAETWALRFAMTRGWLT